MNACVRERLARKSLPSCTNEIARVYTAMNSERMGDRNLSRGHPAVPRRAASHLLSAHSKTISWGGSGLLYTAGICLS